MKDTITCIDFNGNAFFLKTREELERAYNNGYVREAFLNNRKIDLQDLKSTKQ